MRPTVLLWDIDGTLITTGGAGRRAIERAFGERHGRPDAFSGVNFAGMTDRAIVRAGFAAIGRECDDAEIDDVLALYVRILEDEVARAEGYSLHRGIQRALDVTVAAGCATGLGTGNIREGARVKLSRVGIYARFAFGGFGCDHEDRAELIRIGARRGAEALGAPPDECRVVVIGDTPKDIAAAKAIGAESLAVATGGYGVADLAAHAPTWVVSDLAADGALDPLLR